MSKRIPVSGPSITQLEIDYVTDAATNSWGASANVYYERFHKAFAQYIGTKYAISLPSCTSGLHLTLAALGIGPGDEVIVPDVTWIASAAPIAYVGATPVFADIDPDTWCLSADSFEACITEKTKAAICVDLYGNMPDWDALQAIADKHSIKLIEDSAEAFGSQYKGKYAGSLGITGCFSFHGSKTMTTGEGGMLVTNDDDLFSRILFLRDHGRIPGDVSFVNSEIAFKYKMSAMQAAMGLGQVERASELVDGKRKIFSWYAQELADLKGVTLNCEPAGTVNSYWMISIILDACFGIDKYQLIELFKDKNIDTRPFFSPLSSIPAYKADKEAQKAAKQNTTSYAISQFGVNLPSGLQLSQRDVKQVCRALREILQKTKV